MSSSQQDVTRDVLDAVRDFLGGPTQEGDGWRFTFGDHLNSNWGAVFGGALAAGMLAVGRWVMPERAPRSMHVQIVRSVPSGTARAAAIVRHLGRTVATVEVDLYDQRDKLASIALLTMVSPESLAADYDRSIAAPPFQLRDIAQPVAEDQIPGAEKAPIIGALNLSPATVLADNVRRGVDGSSAPVMECTVPWDALEHTGPEAACLIADAAVARAVSCSYISPSAIGPNPDLTLRFSAAAATRVIVAAPTLLSVQRGSTTVGIEVQAGANQLAHALATSLLLDRA
jgi:acyl-coenzyme A thioesterase PaaI-like protein